MSRSGPGDVRRIRRRTAAANLLYVAYVGFRHFRSDRELGHRPAHPRRPADQLPLVADGLFLGGGGGLLWRQLVGVVTVVAFSFVLTWLIAAGVQALIGLRVPPADQERLDEAQQGADAYHLGGVTSLTAPGAPRRRTGAATPGGEPAVPPGRRVRVVTALLEPDPAANSADLRDALLRAISVIVSDVAVATTAPQANLLPRGYWQDQPLAARLRVTVLVGADGVGAVLDELDRMGARRADTFVQEAERVQS
ncbi:hypothetical protein ABZY58_20375 [Micromonospora tulbaghiae]|uniref:hypothetical protein n=1 Tax=Micromonospora tulbaghiae TaxID=479978 RepID=UPI0033B31F5C